MPVILLWREPPEVVRKDLRKRGALEEELRSGDVRRADGASRTALAEVDPFKPAWWDALGITETLDDLPPAVRATMEDRANVERHPCGGSGCAFRRGGVVRGPTVTLRRRTIRASRSKLPGWHRFVLGEKRSVPV